MACVQLRRTVAGLPELAGGAVGGRDAPVAQHALCLLRFASARGLTTGRQPRAVAAAALFLGAAAAGFGAALPLAAAAAALHAARDTAAERCAELRAALCGFAASALPYAEEITPKTLSVHLPFILSLVAATSAADGGGAEGACADAPAEAQALPPSYGRGVAARQRLTAKVAAAQARIAGEAAEQASGRELALVPTARATRAAAAAAAVLPPPPEPPRGTKRMRPLGGKLRTVRRSAAAVAADAAAAAAADAAAVVAASAAAVTAAAAASADAAAAAAALDEEDAEVEALLRAGISPVRLPQRCFCSFAVLAVLLLRCFCSV